MPNRPYSALVFGTAQILFIVFLVSALILQRRRRKKREEALGMKPESIYIRGAIKRTPVPENRPTEEQEAPPQQVGSAFPNWTASTPAHEILEVTARARPEEVEAAFKKLLKRYHPDRFAAWGAGYQNRAHQTILLIQKARDKLLKS